VFVALNVCMPLLTLGYVAEWTRVGHFGTPLAAVASVGFAVALFVALFIEKREKRQQRGA
jgi:hypothetical protein